MGEINVVPYIDVMLVLLIIFMITAPLLTQGIQVDLPQAAAEPLDPELLRDNEPLVLSINSDGELFLNIGGGRGNAHRRANGADPHRGGAAAECPDTRAGQGG